MMPDDLIAADRAVPAGGGAFPPGQPAAAPALPSPAARDDATRRSDRPNLLAFVQDADTEAALREGLAEVVPQGLEVRRAGLRAAIAALQKMPTPGILIVDIAGEDQPLTALDDLSQVVEPDVRVLVIGDRNDVNFYRQVIRGLGVVEYLYKPLGRDMVARHFGPCLTGQPAPGDGVQGGRLVTVTGARGGVGASIIAASLAWRFGVEARRHTLLLDTDLHRGTCALHLQAQTSAGLRTAIEKPQRIDALFIERAAQPVRERLHVLAGEEKLTEDPAYAPGAAARLAEAVRRRYNIIIADLPHTGHAFARDMLGLAHQRVLVMTPTLAAVRDTLRLLAIPAGPLQSRRAVVVLNRLGMQGGLSRQQVEEALQIKVDVTVPDMPRQVGHAAIVGEPAHAFGRGALRQSLLHLAQEVAFVRLLDAADDAPRAATRRRWFGRRR